MAQEFYLRAQTLHEEYQKRELRYLNTEKKLISSVMSKKELNMPFQEYLQKINQREKETQKTYRNILKELEDLDSRTDVMSQKLETLEILRKNLTSVAFLNGPSSIESDLHTYDTPQNFNFKSNVTQFQSLEHSINPMLKTDVKCISTQTENTICCDKCHSIIQIQHSQVVESKTASVSNIQSGIIDKFQSIYSESQRDSNTLNGIHGNSEFILSSENSEHLTKPANKNTFMLGNPNVLEQKNEKPPIVNKQSNVILTENHSSHASQLKSNKSLTASMQNEGKLTESQHSESENYETKSQDAEINVDTLVSKSDAESLNNEFDFLESDTRKIDVQSKTKAKNVLENYKSLSNVTDLSLDKAVSSVVEHSSKPPFKHKDDIFSNTKEELSDNKSEISDSVSDHHSVSISGASDSDSIYGKGSPVTASAAYQALLGNTVIPTKTKISDSDSDSVDEVENALATVVQRSHIKPKSSKTNQVTETERKSSEGKTSNAAVKESKLLSSNKPQSKLSKNTRKVLGLDTSSGSEVEVVKQPEKNETDSDEFDFFDK